MLEKYFTAHPREVGESYGEHLATAAGFGIAMVAGGLACIVHALIPGLCEKTASGIVRDLFNRMDARRAVPSGRPITIEELEWVI